MNVRRTWIGAGVAACVLAGAAGAALANVNWSHESYDQILKRAKAENKYVYIDFFAVWCGPCKMLDAQTYPDPRVSKLLNSMIAVEWDAEKEPWLPLAKQYKVHAYPTLIVLAPDGHEVDRYLGFMPPDDFVPAMEACLQGKGTIATLQAQVDKSPDDRDLLYQLGMKYADAGRSEEATRTLSHALELDPTNATGRTAEILYSLGDANYNDDKYTQAKPYFDRLVSEFADSDWYSEGVQRLAATEFKLGDKDAAVTTYWKLVADKQDDPKALNGFAWFCSQRKIGLDRALPAAQKAADLSGRDPGILDTLAEVYFALGDFDNAIKVETEAAAKDTSDTYLKEQIEKYQKAKAGAGQARS
jgi:thioredoxin